MRETLISIKDLSDSKEMLLMSPNLLIQAFTFIIALLLAAAVIWMSLSKIDVYITATGLVRGDEEGSRLLVINGGKVESVNISDGQSISKGDVLLTFDQQSIYLEQEKISRDIETLMNDIELLKLYRSSIDNLANYLSYDITDKGRAYSLKVENFLKQREVALTQVAEDEKNNELQRAAAERNVNNANDTLKGLQAELKWLQRLRASVENGRDVISMESGDDLYKTKYVSMFQRYNLSINSLELDRKQAQDNLEKITNLYEAGTVPGKEVDDAKNALDNIDNSIKATRQAELANIDSQIADTNAGIDTARKSIQTLEQEVTIYSASRTSPLMQVDQAKIAMLAEIEIEIQQANNSIDILTTQNESLDAQKDNSQLIAPINGILNLNYVINEGEIIPPHTEIGIIMLPESDSFRVSLQVGNKDIAGVKIGQPVKFKFLALPYQQYGMVDGQVRRISPDSTVNALGESFYIVEAEVENKPIESKRGDDESIKVGMAVEGRIIKEQTTIMHWLLEKMRFI